jgi:hypothetical protein
MEDMKSATVTEFVATAAAYCQLLEQAGKQRTGELFGQLQQLLPQLYQKSALLPKPRYCYEEESARFVTEEDYARIHDAMQQKIGLFFGITHMSPGTGPSQFEVMSFGMAEGFTDVYESLKNFVKLYDVGIPQAMNDAVWLYHKSFEQNLGLKLIENLKSLHQMLYNKGSEGSRALQEDDFAPGADEEEPWFSDDQEEVYGDDE